MPPPAADPSAAAELLAERLYSLRALPFCHLVPHPELLPHESVRFFHVDEYWVRSLLLGASSVAASRPGATGTARAIADAAVARGRATAGLGAGDDHRTGVLIRSRLIAQYPGLRIAAGAGGAAVTVRAWYPAPDVLLCLFDRGSAVTWFEIGEPAHALHFGFDEDAHGGLVLNTRDPRTGEPDGHQVRQDRFLGGKDSPAHGSRAVGFARLAEAAGARSPAGLALQLIRTPERQFFGEPPSGG
ncbi:hypothetical protein [Streptomyces sp. XD-27]|uniref:hypothetical protein n=1 Tax=Streptomyces sp. XD-27 TaxID=3062779 RepID=UPI0026F472FD|nr:hypothetical protein [Streptomyces sp. XD-27]WKX74067.1 hypothetical protein Q3Y56_33145 [Streptomyces sp. XD-27]